MSNDRSKAPRPSAGADVGEPSGAPDRRSGGRLGGRLRRGGDRPKRPPRWGLRASLFVTLAVVALFTAEAQGGHTLGTFSCTILGIMGGGYCSFRGLRAVVNLEGVTGKRQ